MKLFKSHFEMSASQRNGILFLIFILLASLGYQYFWMLPKNENVGFAISDEVKSEIQQEIDSLKEASAKANQPKIYPFNPNYLKDFKAYQLGISTEEFDRLQQFRDAGQWINSAADFQEVTQVSDSLLNEIKSYFKFPDWVAQNNQTKATASTKTKTKTFEEKQNLNTASENQLKEISGIGDVLAKRIVRLRTKMDGFIDDIQLKDVYGLNYETREKLLAEFTVKLANKPNRIDINEASVVDLAAIPYFDYELAREIVHFIKVREGISDFEELAKIYDFPMHKIDRIKLYLKIND